MDKRPNIFKVTVHKDGAQWGEYVTAGETYTVESPTTRKGQYHFQGKRGATFMQSWQFKRAVKAGWIVIHTFANPDGAQEAAQ